PGDHVHTHNLVFEEHALDFEYPSTDLPIPAAPADAPTFLGYARPDGRAGTRNYIAVVAASNCAAHTAELIAASYDGKTFPDNVEAARREIATMIDRAASEKRTPVPASKIVLGLNCGGSDSFSGITANPALGVCSDLIAQAGGSAVLAETTEIFGAEHLLIRR